MMKSKMMLAAMIIGAMSMSVAQAETPSVFKDVGVSVKGGTAGVGFDVTKAVTDKFKVRAGYSTFDYSMTHDEDDITYEGELRVGGWNLLADYHPFGGTFRVTGGAYGPKHSFLAKARYTGPTQTIDLNGTTYTSDDLQDIQVSTTWKGVRPYVGVGFDGFNKTTRGLYVTTDVGVIAAGTPTTRLTANCTNPAVCDAARADIAAEEAEMKDSMDSAKYLPVIQFSIGYRF